MNSVELSCTLKEVIDEKHRKVEYNLLSNNEEGKNSQTIIAKYWSNTDSSEFIRFEEGTFLLIRGHLDANKTYGTIIIVETYEKLKLSL